MAELVARLRNATLRFATESVDEAKARRNQTIKEAASEIERLRAALEIASDEILSMYRTWVADDYEAMPPENSLPGKAYYAARSALSPEAKAGRSEG